MPATNTTLVGKDGAHVVGSTQVARSTQWAVNPKLATKSEWGDSDTEGFTARQPGRKDATFTSEGKYDTSSEQFDLFQPGDKAISTLWMNRTTLYWDFPCAMNDDFSMTVNMDTQEVVGWTSAWGADGAYHRPGHADAAARTFPA